VPLESLAPKPRVAEHRGHVGVAREDPEALEGAVDWVVGAEARVQRIGIPQRSGSSELAKVRHDAGWRRT
jgi:hypothetical protein